MKVKIKTCGGVLPQKQHQADACFDCYAREDVIVKPGETKLVPLGFCLELPDGYEAQIRPRSGLSSQGVQVQLGTVDSNYRGEVKACVYNSTQVAFVVGFNTRICQMAVKQVLDVDLTEVDTLSDTDRGVNGFGSTGV